MQQQHKEASSQLVATGLKLLLLRACTHCNLSAQTCMQTLAIVALASSLDYLDHIGYPRTAPDYLRNEELLRDVRNKLN